ncbi:Uncharacterised protein [Mycobacteroides abscessus subsp. abscessus]|nr:hypothetical protein MA4S0116S_4508 [Mycobacteroides abscessus 4S-0116-S]MBE5406288.1 hypothetical protein [Mycobacteroides abscessus]SHQ96208.1 Uncharacterised protein [Mycobacteroides abscessus subsp. abscessus]SIN40044.1 Uncharacterised protein [Mycobacteroides abscessus subsp. bolletii]SKU61815.1 Uncharacterised protein [Mycobacteroides abscessus subsp. massiliense]
MRAVTLAASAVHNLPMTRWTGLMVAAITLTTGGIAASTAVAPNVACACSCVDVRKDSASIKEWLGHAQAIFVGTPTDTQLISDPETGRTIYQFAVREVYKGDVGPTTTVKVENFGPTCGRSYDIGTEYFVVAGKPDEIPHDTRPNAPAAYGDNRCSLTQVAAGSDLPGPARTAYGTPHAPTGPAVTLPG